VIRRKLGFILLLTLVGGPRVYAQSDLVPPVSQATTPPAAPSANLWSFLLPTAAQKEACKTKFCKSPFGQLLNGATRPASLFTGGLIGPLCPDPLTTANPEDMNKPPNSPQGAAAKIKMNEAQAKARIAALEYLGTVDCRYYPEAEAALINGLRADTNECVRATAARVLARGCCCTPKILKALTLTVNGSNKDGNPAERSELVLAYAYVALERCLKCCIDVEPEPMPEKPLERPENPPSPEKALSLAVEQFSSNLAPLVPIGSEENTTNSATSRTKLYAEARAALAKGIKLSSETITRLSRPRTLSNLFSNTIATTSVPMVSASPEVKPRPSGSPQTFASSPPQGDQTEKSESKSLFSIYQSTKRK
jgi:hypothetical protein